MENKEKENISFALGISLSHESNRIKPKMIVRNVNMPNEIIMIQLKFFIKSLEEENYPDFKNNLTKIGFSPE